MADESCARTISALAPCAIRLSISVNCFCAEDCASAEMYLSPAAAIAAFIAASSVFHRSSWKFDQETPIVLSLASAKTTKANNSATPANKAAADLPISTLPRAGNRLRPVRLPQSLFQTLKNTAFQSFLYTLRKGRMVSPCYRSGGLPESWKSLLTQQSRL